MLINVASKINQFSELFGGLSLVFGELFLLTTACIILITDLFLKQNSFFKKITNYTLSQAAILITAIICWASLFAIDNNSSGLAYKSDLHYGIDSFSQILKISILLIVSLVLVYSRDYVAARKIAYGEFHLLVLFASLGMMVLCSGKSLVSLYLGLELLSLPLYILVAFDNTKDRSVEAAMKYFVLGAIASAMLLYGFSIIYGVTGSIYLPEISNSIANLATSNLDSGLSMLLFGLVFIILAIAFKFGAVPCHMWVPDVYQGAPTCVTLFISSAPKVAAFGLAYRLFNDGFLALGGSWSPFFITLAVLSMAIGNITAIVQTNLKRLLAYSTIAHVGFVFLAIAMAPFNDSGFMAGLYYIVVYALMAACSFGVITLLSNNGLEVEKIEDLNGLANKSPWIAFLLLLVAFSLAGLPPLVGFYAKFLVLKILVESGYIWLAGLSVFFSIIGAFYYLRIVRAIYFAKPSGELSLKFAADSRIVISINGLLILALGILPGILLSFYQAAI